MKNIFLFIAIFLPATLIAQNWYWAKHLGGPGLDKAYIGHIDGQQNIYLYGRYAVSYATTNYSNCYIENDTLFGQKDAFIAKYNENGNILWVKNCVSPNGTIGFEFTFDTLNNAIYISGSYDISCNIDTCTIYSGYNSTGFIAKLDTSGNCIWAKNITAPSFVTTTGGPLTTDSNGNIYIGGTTNATNTIDTSTITPGTFLAKFDSDGNNLWAKTKFSWTGFQSQMGIKSLKYFNGNIYASGFVWYANYGDTIKIDTISITNYYHNGYGIVCMDTSNSFTKWVVFDGFPNYFPYGSSTQFMDLDPNGNIYYSGTFNDTCIIQQDTLVANSTSNSIISKYDPNGNLLLIKQVFSTNEVYAEGINVVGEDVFLTGALSGQASFGSFNIAAATQLDMYIARYDKYGNCIGVNHAGVGLGLSVDGKENSLYVVGIFPPIPTASGSISIAGNTFSNYGWEDIIFAKHDMFTGLGGEGRHANNQLVIYANPNKGSFKLKIPDEFAHEPNLTLNIFDNSGKLISQQQLKLCEDHPVMNIFGQAAGSYNVTLTNGKKVYYGRMVVE